jgi:hypothetical protein
MIRLATALCALAAVLPATAGGQPRWILREDLRIGSADEEAELFNDIRGIAVGARGAILVLDFKAQEIRMFDARGEFIRRVAREGSGPGEIRNANGLQMAPNGEIWVNDPANARYSVFSPAGDFLRQHSMSPWGYGYIWDAMIDRSGVLHEPFSRRTADGKATAALRRFNPARKVTDILPLPFCASRVGDLGAQVFIARGSRAQSNYAMPFLARPITALDARGFAWCSSRDRYEVLKLGVAKRDTVLRIVSNAPPVPIPKAERDSAIDVIRNGFAKLGVPQPDFSGVPTTKPVIAMLDPDNQGGLWVRRSDAAGQTTRIDLWDARGKLRAVVTAPFRLSASRRLLIRGDTVYTVVTDADDVPYVVRALLVRSAGP